MKGHIDDEISDPEKVTLLKHENGINIDDNAAQMYKNVIEHDPTDINKAREIVEDDEKIVVGLIYQNKEADRYDVYGSHNLGFTPEEKEKAINVELDKYAV